MLAGLDPADIFERHLLLVAGSVPFQGATSGMTYDLILNRGPVPVRSLRASSLVAASAIVLIAT